MYIDYYINSERKELNLSNKLALIKPFSLKSQSLEKFKTSPALLPSAVSIGQILARWLG